MEQILRWLGGIGSDPLPPGESLRFDFLAKPQGGLGLAFLLGFVLVIVGIYLIYRRDAAKLPFGKRFTLATLRVLALLVVVLLLLEPSLIKVRKTVRPGEVILLVDASQSMSHKDSYLRSPEWADGWKAIGAVQPSDVTRMNLAKRVLASEGLFDELAKKNRVRVYAFGGSIRPAPEVEKPGTTPRKPANEERRPTSLVQLPPPPELDLTRLEPTEGSTNLTASVRQALEASHDSRVAAVIVLSDGRKNAGGPPEEAGAYLQRRKVGKLFVVGVGDPAETWTVSLREVLGPERVFKGDPLKLSAIVVSQGYGEQTLNVRLVEVDAEGKKVRDLQNVTVDVGGERSSAEARFPPLELKKEGDHWLRVEVDPPSGETFEDDRHARTHKVEVLSEKLRVLMIAGSPTHEYRILRNQLIRDNTIDVSCWLQSADTDFPQDGNTTIKELPTLAKDLDVYDVVVMVDPDPVLLTPGFIEMVRSAVEERGFGMWWVMGEKFSLHAARPGSPLTSLVDLLPVELDIATAEQRENIGRYFKMEHRWKLATAGKDHRVTSLKPDPVVNEMFWPELPGFYWCFPVLRPKPAAHVLVKPRGGQGLQEEQWPLLALHFVGAGRVLFSGSDETYRWRSVAEKEYNDLWIKGLRWLYEGKLTGGSSRYRLGASVETVTLGKEVEIYLRALDPSYMPLVAESVKVRLAGPGGFAREIDLPRAPVGEGRFQGHFRPNAIGTWTVQALGDTGEPAGRAVTFEVIRSELESKGPMGLAELSRLAESGPEGELVKPAELQARIASEVRSASTEETFTLPFPLWDKWLTLFLVLFFLTIEWVLRKRFDML